MCGLDDNPATAAVCRARMGTCVCPLCACVCACVFPSDRVLLQFFDIAIKRREDPHRAAAESGAVVGRPAIFYE